MAHPADVLRCRLGVRCPVSVELTHPLVVSADLTRQVLVSLQIVWPSWTASVHAGCARRQGGVG
jgi:hypothetical protein